MIHVVIAIIILTPITLFAVGMLCNPKTQFPPGRRETPSPR